jgi:HNH endonuclease
MKPVSARVPSTRPISQNMIDHSIVDAGSSLKRLAKLAWGFDFESLIIGDDLGAVYPVYYSGKRLNLKFYRPRVHGGRFFRLSLDAILIETTSLSSGDVMLFDLKGDGRVELTLDKSGRRLVSNIGKRRTFQLSPSFSFSSEGDIQKHERWERTRCSRISIVVKQREFKRFGRLSCHACGLRPVRKYGVEVIEAHHRKPLAECQSGRTPDPDDFDLLCPSCHRAIHRLSPCDLSTLRREIRRNAKQEKPGQDLF